jgi:tetratricopeptide (TPR) repeat protein
MNPERKAKLRQHPIERVSAWVGQIGSWIEGHLRFVGLGTSLILVVVVMVVGLSVYWSYERESGLAAIRSGFVEMSNDQIERAIPYFESAADKLDGHARRLALLKLGEAYEKQDQPGKALQAYEGVLKNGSTEEAHYLVQFALLRLGKAAEEESDTELARSRYTEAAEIEGPGQLEALLAMAKILEQEDDGEGAKSYYRKYLDSEVNSPLKEVIEQKVD